MHAYIASYNKKYNTYILICAIVIMEERTIIANTAKAILCLITLNFTIARNIALVFMHKQVTSVKFNVTMYILR